MKFLAITLLTCTAFGADLSVFETRLTTIASATTPAARESAVNDMLNDFQTIVTATFTPSLATIVREYRSMRNDAQTGASSGSAGSTSLVLNPYFADIFGVSFEAGAILKTVSGNTINFQVKPAGIFCGVRDGDATKAAPGAGCLEFWKRVGFAVAFDTSRSDAPSQLVALQNDFSQFRAHFDLLEPTVKKAREAAMTAMREQGPAASEVALLFTSNERLKQWAADTKTDLMNVTGNTDDERKKKLEQVWNDDLQNLERLLRTNADLQKVAPSLAAFARMNTDANLRALVVDKLVRTSFAVEYSLDRADVAKADIANGIVTKGQRPPDLSTARLIYARSYQPLVLTANAEMSWFNQSLPGMKGQFRDWQISAAATFLLKEIPNFGKTTLSFGGLVGDLRQQPLGFDYTIPLPSDPRKTQKIDLAGPIRAFNARLEFPTANRSVTIPFSFTYANRTDLVKETDVRGSVGLTVRFDSLFPTKR